MFTGTVESRSHEGGLLVHFEGSSPSLNAIIVRSEDGSYIGKIDGVLGSTDHPLAHVAHVDRALDMEALIGAQVSVRVKQRRTEDRGRSGGRTENRNQDERPWQRGNQRQDRNRSERPWQRDNRNTRDRQTGRQQQGFDDWTCPACNNSNFARRQSCNRCDAPRPSGGGQRSNQRFYGQDRGQRDNRRGQRDNSRGRSQQHGDNDWTCPACNNSNFSFRTACNRCEAPKPEGGGGGGQRRQNRSGDAPRRQGGRSTYGDRRGRPSNNDRRHGGRSGDRREHRGRSDDRREQRNEGRQESNRGPPNSNRRRSNQDSFRRAKGKRSGHAHNQPPRDFREPRRFERSDD